MGSAEPLSRGDSEYFSKSDLKCRNCSRVISPGVQTNVNPWKGRDWTIKSSRSLTRNIIMLKMILKKWQS